MSYDFTPTHHIGYTPQGSLITGTRHGASTSKRRAAIKPFKTGIQALSLFDLRKLCFDKDPEAIEEYTRRTWAGEV